MYDVVIRLYFISIDKIKKVVVEKIRVVDCVRICITLKDARSFDTIKRLWK